MNAISWSCWVIFVKVVRFEPLKWRYYQPIVLFLLVWSHTYETRNYLNFPTQILVLLLRPYLVHPVQVISFDPKKTNLRTCTTIVYPPTLIWTPESTLYSCSLWKVRSWKLPLAMSFWIPACLVWNSLKSCKFCAHYCK